MTHQDYFVLTETMIRYGGNFMQKLAEAIRAADSDNKQKIIDVYPDVVEKYGPNSAFAKNVTTY